MMDRTTAFIRHVSGRMPAAVQAALVALMILFAGQLVPGICLYLSLRHTPRAPWFLPATVASLLLFWMYLNGHGWPAATAATRREHLRATTLPLRTWLWSLLAGGLGMAGVLSGALLTGRIATLPSAAYAAPFDLSSYPSWTVIAFFANVALVAGVVEEAAFRGYMLSILEHRYGWPIAILGVAALFYVVHLSHAYAAPAFIPFFAAYSVLHGVLVWLTRSIKPSIVLHALGDFTILPIQYGVIASPFDTSIRTHIFWVASLAIAALIALWCLSRVVPRAQREEAAPISH